MSSVGKIKWGVEAQQEMKRIMREVVDTTVVHKTKPIDALELMFYLYEDFLLDIYGQKDLENENRSNFVARYFKVKSNLKDEVYKRPDAYELSVLQFKVLLMREIGGGVYVQPDRFSFNGMDHNIRIKQITREVQNVKMIRCQKCKEFKLRKDFRYTQVSKLNPEGLTKKCDKCLREMEDLRRFNNMVA